MDPFPTVPHEPYTPPEPPTAAARRFYEVMRQRRSVRDFSTRPIDLEAVRLAVAAACTAPSGANKQPWRYVLVTDPALKREIREGAEAEEREFYERRATPEWLADLAPLGTDTRKPFLETAPCLIVVFKLMKTDPDDHAVQGRTYYVEESVGISVGLLLASLHHAGFATLTHTPSPMAFLARILGRPPHERPFLLIPVGHAAYHCRVPAISRKPLAEVLVER